LIDLHHKLMKRGMASFILVRGFLFTGVIMAVWLPLFSLIVGDPIDLRSGYWMTIAVWSLIGTFISAIEYVYFEREYKKLKI
jgi:hypothetical protein